MTLPDYEQAAYLIHLVQTYASQPWKRSDATIVIHGTVCTPRVFYYHYGTGKVYSVSSSDNLTDEDLVTYWNLVEEADRTEIQSFVDFKVFKSISHTYLHNIQML